MSETIALSGTTFTLTGTFRDHQQELHQRIEQGGGKVQAKLGARVDVVVAGRSAGEVVQHARYRGVPVISEAELERLLAGEEIEVVFETPEVFDEGALLSELRGLLNTSAGVEVWPRLVRLLDRCAPALMDTAVHYASTYLDRIDATLQSPLCAPNSLWRWRRAAETDRLEGTEDWVGRMPDVRRWRPAPLHWIGQLSQGARSPKFSLINTLHLSGSQLSAGQIATALANPALTGVRALDLSGGARYGKVAFKALCENEALQQLVSLTLDHNMQGMTHARLLAEQDALPALRRLDLHHVYMVEATDPLITLGCSAWGERIETLGLHLMLDVYRRPLLTPQAHLLADLLVPNARRVLLDPHTPSSYDDTWRAYRLDSLIASVWWPALLPALSRVEAFGLVGAPAAQTSFAWHHAARERLAELAALQVLDLSHVSMEELRFLSLVDDPDGLEAEAWHKVARSPLTRHTGRVWLGALHQHAAPRFEAVGIEVVTEPPPHLLT